MYSHSYRKPAVFVFIMAILCVFSLAAEEPVDDGKPCMVETSAWMIANLLPDPPDFYQLCLGYRLDAKNAVFLNGITWKYPAPLGIPMWDPAFDSPDENYPGYVRAFGVGLGYQRFIWKGLFASVYAIPFMQRFHANDDRLIQTGFQLYLQTQIGYQVDLFKGRVFLKPAIYVNYWPINTGFPDAFLLKERNWPNYQPFEPHLNFGFRF